MARYATEAISHKKAVEGLDAIVGVPQSLPLLSNIARNDGLLAEALAAQFSKELGIKVHVLQNSSRHGVDLYAFDATTNRIEVKSSMHETYGQAPATGPEEFFRQRVARAVAGTGHWAGHNVAPDLMPRAIDIQTNLRQNAPSVVGFKYEISIPEPGNGQAAAPVLVVKRWGP